MAYTHGSTFAVDLSLLRNCPDSVSQRVKPRPRIVVSVRGARRHHRLKYLDDNSSTYTYLNDFVVNLRYGVGYSGTWKLAKFLGISPTSI